MSKCGRKSTGIAPRWIIINVCCFSLTTGTGSRAGGCSPTILLRWGPDDRHLEPACRAPKCMVPHASCSSGEALSTNAVDHLNML